MWVKWGLIAKKPKVEGEKGPVVRSELKSLFFCFHNESAQSVSHAAYVPLRSEGWVCTSFSTSCPLWRLLPSIAPTTVTTASLLPPSFPTMKSNRRCAHPRRRYVRLQLSPTPHVSAPYAYRATPQRVHLSRSPSRAAPPNYAPHPPPAASLRLHPSSLSLTSPSFFPSFSLQPAVDSIDLTGEDILFTQNIPREAPQRSPTRDQSVPDDNDRSRRQTW
jgi:hypothetical protein